MKCQHYIDHEMKKDKTNKQTKKKGGGGASEM